MKGDHNMRALILTGSAGQGHNSTARAIGEVLSARGSDYEIRDGLSFISGRLPTLLSRGHTKMYRSFPGLFRRGYTWLENHRGACREGGALYRFLAHGARELRLHLEQGQYDSVICTHIFAGLMLTEALRQHPMDIRTCLVATDYTCSPGTEHCRMDYYAIPHADLAPEFIAHGIPSAKLLCHGLPVRGDFLVSTDKFLAKKALRIPKDRPHLLIMCGSMGCGPLKELTCRLGRELPPETEVTVVCGTNKKLLQILSQISREHKNIHILGYREDISLLMDSADLYLTKPGGISVSEAAAKGLPMVLIDVVAGCEKYNLRFFLAHGGAVTAKTPRQLARLCASMLEDPAALAEMRDNLRTIHTFGQTPTSA